MVRDAHGAFVGYAVYAGYGRVGGALRIIDDVAVVLPAVTTGFFDMREAPALGYPMADCAGQPYLLSGSYLSVVQAASTMGNQAIFSLGEGTDPVSVKSVRPGTEGYDPYLATICGKWMRTRIRLLQLHSHTPTTFGPLQPARVLDLDTLGLVPPFRVDSPQ